MTMNPNITLRIAAQAIVAIKTARRYLQNKPVRPVSRARIEAALIALGLPELIHGNENKVLTEC